ncbi:N-acyl homoserine lactonase [Coniochaeta hoffmannii]|uniref:N-acyl homoserine lactonase n=1 Tax=Coniochaeta hoffmannii TaxID=91930 RepID=A0AA38VNY8_9PEZI|nr:N-acyl homoserine lactonase [Coniochaeta hoffmannii]
MASAKDNPVYVTVSALDAGHLTLPESLFVTDADPSKRATVPSLAFLIQHPSSPRGRPDSNTTNLVFDLGIKRNLKNYAPSQEAHIANRQPVITDPDCAASLRAGGLDPAAEVDVVVLSHVHWDHVGTASDFPRAAFVVGSGTLDLLRNGAGPLYPADIFNDDEIPPSRTVELPPVRDRSPDVSNGVYVEPRHTPAPATASSLVPTSARDWAWRPLAAFPAALDFFGDGSFWIVDSPGHLYGHVNALARVGPGKYVYLGGDCCHDPRILRGEKGIALYDDGRGGKRSVHVHTGVARRTLDWIDEFVRRKRLEGEEEVDVEVVVAHDGEWREKNRGRFWPGHL